MSKTYTTLSREGYTYLIGLIRNLANVSEGIDDLHLLSNGTFSSVKIDTLLNTLRSDCNEYTDRLVANLSRLELKIANDESEISQPNIMYLYKASGETSYSQYVVIEGTKILLGTCDIDMGDYYTITQADAKFVLKTDFDSLKNKLTTHTDDTNIHVTSAERTKWNEVDNKVNKSSILTAISDIPSDNNLLSEKVIKSELDKKSNNTDLNNLSQGILVGSTSSMNENILLWDVGHYYFNLNSVWKSYKNIPNTEYAPHVYVTSVKPTKYKDIDLNSAEKKTWFRQIKVDGHLGKSFIRTIYVPDINDVINLENGKLLSSGSDTGWQRVCTTSVQDTSLKKLKNSSDINSDADITYIVKNGMCNVSVNTVSSTKMETGNITLTTGLPIPVNTSCWYSLSTNSNATTAPLQNLLIRIDSSGNMIAYNGSNNANYFGSFSYPVAES